MSEFNSLPSAPTVIHATKFRWVVLFGLSLQTWLNGFLWISLAPVTNYAISYYKTSEWVLNSISLLFSLGVVVLGLPSAAFIDICGLWSVLIVIIASNMLSGLLRFISVFLSGATERLVLLFAAQICASIITPLSLFVPTNLALVWFPDTQRTTATTVFEIANAFGVLVGFIYPPFLVHNVDDIGKLNTSIAGITFAACLFTLPATFKSRPNFPPSVAAAAIDRAYLRYQQANIRAFLCNRIKFSLKSVHNLLRNRGYLILCFCFSMGLSYVSTLSALMQQILCTKGYSDEFAGLCGACLTGSGCLVAFFVALIVDKTKALLFGFKICFSLAVLGSVGLSVVFYFPGQSFLLLTSVIFIGAFGFSVLGLALEMAAECTYPTSETISTGLMLISSQLVTIIFIFLLQSTAPVVSDSTVQVCGPHSKVQDYSIPNQVIVCFLAILTVIQLFWMDLPYLRRTAELTGANLLPDTELPVEDIETGNVSRAEIEVQIDGTLDPCVDAASHDQQFGDHTPLIHYKQTNYGSGERNPSGMNDVQVLDSQSEA